MTHFLHSHHPSPETHPNPPQHRPRQANHRQTTVAATDMPDGVNAHHNHPPTTTAPTRTPVTTNSNTDSMMDSGHLHQQEKDPLAQRLQREPPNIGCCSSDNPIRDLEVLQQMAEILVAEQELKERKKQKVTTTNNENSMKSTSQTQAQELPPLDDTNINVEDGVNSSRSGSSVGSNNDHTNDSQIDDDDLEDSNHATHERQLLLRMSMNTAVAIGLHNFPEGLATFVAALNDPSVGVVLAIAIAIHNIPEGLCVALPVYYATGSRRKAFGWAILSGLSEPLAAVFGYIILANAVTSTTYGILFGIVAGMMVMISTRELLPTAHRYDPTDRVVTYSFIFGMAALALSLVLFGL